MIILCKECQHEVEYYDNAGTPINEAFNWGYFCKECQKDVTNEVDYIDDHEDMPEEKD